jgi:hypothetical protein
VFFRGEASRWGRPRPPNVCVANSFKTWGSRRRRAPRERGAGAALVPVDRYHDYSGAAYACRRRGFLLREGEAAADAPTRHVHRSSCDTLSVMILPQVHLRKPCYDFYFL